MKKYLIFLIFISLTSSCGYRSLIEVKNDKELKKSIKEFVSYFEENNLTNCSFANSQNCYQLFFSKRAHLPNKGYIGDDINVDMQVVEAIFNSYFKDVFNASYMNYNDNNSQIKGKYLAYFPNFKGIYGLILEAVYERSKNPKLKEYCYLLLSKETLYISPTVFLMQSYKELNFNDMNTKFLVIIHLICLNKTLS